MTRADELRAWCASLPPIVQHQMYARARRVLAACQARCRPFRQSAVGSHRYSMGSQREGAVSVEDACGSPVVKLELTSEYGMRESRDMTDEEWRRDALSRGSPVERAGENRGLVMPDKEGNRGVVQVHEVGETWFAPTLTMREGETLPAFVDEGDIAHVWLSKSWLSVAEDRAWWESRLEEHPLVRFPRVEGLDA